jgi:hypothetical protein
VILNRFQHLFRHTEPTTLEFVALFDATFAPYAEVRDQLFRKLATNLHPSELVSWINVEIKNSLFDTKLCQGIPDALKNLRRAIIRIEDLRKNPPTVPAAVNDLARLSLLGERLEGLYQKHWELFRYPTHLNEEALVSLVMEIHSISADWQAYFTTFSTVQQLNQTLSDAPIGDNLRRFQVTYSQSPPNQFSVATLTSLLDFFDAAYRYIANIRGLDHLLMPLAIHHVDVSEPVELDLLVPADVEEAYRTFLQYLFLKDLLRRDSLLKFVCEVVEKSYRTAADPSAQTTAGLQKELAAALKRLPDTARLTLAGRVFPDDAIPVLQDFTASLERNQLDPEPLLRGPEKPKASTKTKPNIKAPEASPSATGSNSPKIDLPHIQGRDFLHLLTEKVVEP